MRTGAIGIDPDSTGGVCSLVDLQRAQVTVKEFSITQEALSQFVRWAKRQSDVVIAIEGVNGHSAPFERALRAAGIVFHSFTAHEVSKFRSAVLGQNKNNARDAQAVARYALALEAQKRLDLSRRVWFVDEELQGLTRLYRQKRAEATRETNRLWKTLHKASGDLYLAFRGSNRLGDTLLKQVGILRLLANQPDVGSWHLFSRELVTIMGPPHRSREQLLQKLLPLLASVGHFSAPMCALIRTSAEILLVLHKVLLNVERQIQDLTKDNPAVKCLCAHRGMGVLTAASIMAEIIDIRRFPTNNHLASYAGLARHERKTGRSMTELATSAFNHRLKYALFSAARNMTVNDPSSHLSAYYRHLVQTGMPITEAHKRVSRALVRTIYRELMSLVQVQSPDGSQIPPKEGDVATDLSRQARSAPSNTPPSSQQYTPADKPIYASSGQLRKQAGALSGRAATGGV